MSDATIHGVNHDLSDILGRTENIKPKLRGTKRKIEEIETYVNKVQEELKTISPEISMEERIRNAGTINLNTNPPTLAEIQQAQAKQDILNDVQEKTEHFSATLDKIEQEEQDHKAQRSTQNTNKNLGKQLLIKGLVGTAGLIKTLGTAYFMATLNAGRPEAGAGAEATMNRNNEQIFGSLGQLSTFNLGLGMMPMDNMMGGGMMPFPQMNNMMPMPFNPLGMGGQPQEKPFDPMAGLLQLIASSLNSPPISFGGFEPQNMPPSHKKEGSLSMKIGNNTLTFPNQESKNDFIDKHDAILETLDTEKLPTQDARHKAEQDLAQLFIQTARRAIGMTALPSQRTFVREAKKVIEDYITENLSEEFKPFYEIGIRHKEDFDYFNHNIDTPHIHAYADILKSINDNNVDFPDIQYKSLKEAIKANAHNPRTSPIISNNIANNLEKILNKKDYELIDNLFSKNNKNHDITLYANKLQECAKSTHIEGTKDPKQDEKIQIAIKDKTMAFTASDHADWVTKLFPRQRFSNQFSCYAKNIERISASTEAPKYEGVFVFAVAGDNPATPSSLYTLKLNAIEDPDKKQEIDTLIDNITTHKAGADSRAEILKLKNLCTGLDFKDPAIEPNAELIRQDLVVLPIGGQDLIDFLAKTAKDKAETIKWENH